MTDADRRAFAVTRLFAMLRPNAEPVWQAEAMKDFADLGTPMLEECVRRAVRGEKAHLSNPVQAVLSRRRWVAEDVRNGVLVLPRGEDPPAIAGGKAIACEDATPAEVQGLVRGVVKRP